MGQPPKRGLRQLASGLALIALLLAAFPPLGQAVEIKDDWSEYTITFADGTVVSGSNRAGEAGYTGKKNEADLGLSEFVHVSCSDRFGFGRNKPDGWGEKGAPVLGEDPMPVVAYSIRKYKHNKLDKTCGFSVPALTATPAIDIEKLVSIDGGTSFVDADTPTGPEVPVGSDVIIRLLVTNSGNVALSSLTLTDPDLQAQIDSTCPLPAVLAAADDYTCDLTVAADLGRHMNIASVSGRFEPGAAEPLYSGDKYAFTFLFDDGTVVAGTSGRNKYDAGLSEDLHISCSDHFGFGRNKPDGWGEKGSPVLGVDPSPITAYLITRFKSNGELHKTCGFGDPTPPPITVSDRDRAYYLGLGPSVAIEKSTNGHDADAAPGPTILSGEPVEWTYVVRNPGRVPLDDIVVNDDQVGAVDCPTDTLDPNEAMTCVATGSAEPGQYANVATVTATFRGHPATDSDPSHYFGADPALDLDKLTFEEDADAPPGPVVLTGDEVVWAYVVSNVGNVDLTGVSVIDDREGSVCEIASLAVGDTVRCELRGVAGFGQYANEGIASAEFLGRSVTGTDLSHHLAGVAEIDLEKTDGFGFDADVAPGPLYVIGNRVDFHFVVSNSGTLEVTEIAVVDDVLGVISCPRDQLQPAASMICLATSRVVEGEQVNIAEVTGSAMGYSVSDSDAFHYSGVTVDLSVEKSTNGEDADAAPGPAIAVGDEVIWTYELTNTGTAPLRIVEFDDSIEGAVCPELIGTTLAPTTAISCTHTGEAVAGRYSNVARAKGLFEGRTGAEGITAADASHHFGWVSGIDIEKLVNGEEADVAPGALVPLDDPLRWEFVVTTSGNVEIDGVVVTDDILGSVSGPESGDDDGDGRLDPGESWVYQLIGVEAEAGPGMNTASVVGQPALDDGTPLGDPVEDSDAAYYFGSAPAVRVEKSTNGVDADEAPGPLLGPGQFPSWLYVVTNTGNVPVEVRVTDDIEGVICTRSLGVGHTTECDHSGDRELGQYSNVATVTATPQVGDPVTATDASHYFGVEPSISIDKTRDPAAQEILVGTSITWTYTVTNTGDAALTGVAVIDDQEETVSCPRSVLDIGESMECSLSAEAVAGNYVNVAAVTAAWSGGTVSASAEDRYRGIVLGLRLEKATNGHDAGVAPGPSIVLGTPVTWTYVVSNTGNRSTSFTLVDDKLGVISCPTSVVGVGASVTCTASGAAVLGQYANTATVTGTGLGTSVTASDSSHYLGVE